MLTAVAFHAFHRIVTVEDTWRQRLTDENTGAGIGRFRKREDKGLSLHSLSHTQMAQHCVEKLLILSNIFAMGWSDLVTGLWVSSFSKPDFQMKVRNSQIKTVNTVQLGNKRLNSSDRNSTICRIEVPQKRSFLPTGSSDLISVANEIWFCQLVVLKEYLSLLCWW